MYPALRYSNPGEEVKRSWPMTGTEWSSDGEEGTLASMAQVRVPAGGGASSHAELVWSPTGR